MLRITLLFCCSLLVGSHSFGQQFEDSKTFQFDVSQLTMLRIHNMNGEVNVTATSGRQATMKVTRTLSAATSEKLETAKKEVYWDSLLTDGELIFFMQSPDYELRADDEGNLWYNSCCHDDWNKNRLKYRKLKYNFDVELKVPANTPLYATTHRSEMSISGLSGGVIAKNHHKSIQMDNISGNVKARTHHGDITISLNANPTEDSSFKTHHGDIKIYFQRPLSADVNLSSRHGDFFTDFDWQPQPMKTSVKSDGKGTVYKIGGGTSVRIGNGGPELSFKTWHGDVHLLENK